MEEVKINGKKAIGKYYLKNQPDKPIYAFMSFEKYYYCGNLLEGNLRKTKQEAYLDAGIVTLKDQI